MSELGKCEAQVVKVQTTADGGARITLDVGRDGAPLAARLLANKIDNNDHVQIIVQELD